jgi:hypothetical protein
MHPLSEGGYGPLPGVQAYPHDVAREHLTAAVGIVISLDTSAS